jgi:hypothetical protein
MGLVSILIGGLIVILASFYVLNNYASNRNNLNGNPSNTQQTPMDSARDAQIISDFQAIQTSLNLYKAQKGQYPDNLQVLKDENMIQSDLKNPYTQKGYTYELNGGSYILSTNLGTGKLHQVSN